LEDGLLDALSRLPNGRYRVYYQEQNSERIRLVREVEVYQGRVVPPDFRSDVSERQPISTPAAEPEAPPTNGNEAEPPTEEVPDGGTGTASPPDGSESAAKQTPDGTWTETSRLGATGAAAVAVSSIEFGGNQRWSEQIDRAYESGRRTRRARSGAKRRGERERTD
jgi:hypothetical protein